MIFLSVGNTVCTYVGLRESGRGQEGSRACLSLLASGFVFGVLRLMSLHVCLPARYVGTRQAGIRSAASCQIQKSLCSINQRERCSQFPVSFLPPNIVQASR